MSRPADGWLFTFTHGCGRLWLWFNGCGAGWLWKSPAVKTSTAGYYRLQSISLAFILGGIAASAFPETSMFLQ